MSNLKNHPLFGAKKNLPTPPLVPKPITQSTSGSYLDDEDVPIKIGQSRKFRTFLDYKFHQNQVVSVEDVFERKQTVFVMIKYEAGLACIPATNLIAEFDEKRIAKLQQSEDDYENVKYMMQDITKFLKWEKGDYLSVIEKGPQLVRARNDTTNEWGWTLTVLFMTKTTA